MPAYYDSEKGRWYFEFSKVINKRRVRARKLLPKGWNRAKAEAYARDQESQLYAVATGQGEQRELIEDAVELYTKHRCPHLQNGDGVIKELARFHWAYKGRFMDELQQVGAEYVEFERDRGELSPASVKNRLSYLRAACRYAQKFHGMADGLLLRIAMPAVNNERQHYAQRADMLKIARLCRNRYARAVVRLGFYSGMRIGEMMSIGHTSVWTGDEVFLRQTKNGEVRTVPVHPRAQVLKKYFPNRYSKIWMQRLVREAMDNAGFKHLVLHDLRHSTASAMINAGVDLYTIGAVLGHKDQRSTKRYTHLATKTLAAAIRKIK